MFIYFYLIFHNYVNRLKVEKLEAMAKLHTHYITKAQKELKYAYAGSVGMEHVWDTSGTSGT